MTIVDFCRSEHGTGINQSKLYRKLRRFVKDRATGDLCVEFEDFQNYGFRVEEDDQGQLRYYIYRPDLFCELAERFASSRGVELSPAEHATMVQALIDYSDAYHGENEEFLIIDKETGGLARDHYDEYFLSLDQIIDKLTLLGLLRDSDDLRAIRR